MTIGPMEADQTAQEEMTPIAMQIEKRMSVDLKKSQNYIYKQQT